VTKGVDCWRLASLQCAVHGAYSVLSMCVLSGHPITTTHHVCHVLHPLLCLTTAFLQLCTPVPATGVDLLRAFVSRARRSAQRYAGVDSDPEVVYERMPGVHFAIDGKGSPGWCHFAMWGFSVLIHSARCAYVWTDMTCCCTPAWCGMYKSVECP
jgi:hypothetical protein